MDALALLVAGMVAAAVVLLVIGIASRDAATAVDRVALYPTPTPQPIQPMVTPGPSAIAAAGSVFGGLLGRSLRRSQFSERLARDLNRADLTLTPTEYLAFRAAAIMGAVAIAWLLGATILPALSSSWALLAAAAVGFLAPGIYIGRRQSARLKAFNDQLAETVTLLGNGLRAGSSLLQSMEMVTRETRPPISTEFARVVREVSIGLPLETALNNLVERVRSEDLDLMATAIAIQYQVGGNLSEILETIAQTIRERVRIQREIRTLTAQQRLSGYIIGFLPGFLLILLMVIAPKFINPMFEKPPELFGLPMGVFLLGLGAVMILIGFVIIRRIIDIEV